MSTDPRKNTRSAATDAQKRVITKIKDRLKQTGVNLDMFRWNFMHGFGDANGFYFDCADYERLIDACEGTRKMELNFADLPAQDPWAKQGTSHIGYIETNVGEPVGIDFAVGFKHGTDTVGKGRAGDCRAYIVPHASKARGEAHRLAQVKAAKDKDVYNEIAKRLLQCDPPVVLDDHLGRMLKVGTTTLDGVNFLARDYKKLKEILVNAKGAGGDPFFAHAILENSDHWALKASFGVTNGTGFREVSQVKLSSSPLIGENPLGKREYRGMRRDAGRFTGAMTGQEGVPDLTSLHCAISFDGCNIHIDDVGFVLRNERGELVVDPDMLQHIGNELLWKTFAAKVIPENFVNRVNLVLPSTFNDFNRVGVSVDAYKTKNLNLTVSATCSVFGDRECSATISLSGRFH